jgi:hypothetical protein
MTLVDKSVNLNEKCIPLSMQKSKINHMCICRVEMENKFFLIKTTIWDQIIGNLTDDWG